jgi:hypothetical protein
MACSRQLEHPPLDTPIGPGVLSLVPPTVGQSAVRLDPRRMDAGYGRLDATEAASVGNLTRRSYDPRPFH